MKNVFPPVVGVYSVIEESVMKGPSLVSSSSVIKASSVSRIKCTSMLMSQAGVSLMRCLSQGSRRMSCCAAAARWATECCGRRAGGPVGNPRCGVPAGGRGSCRAGGGGGGELGGRGSCRAAGGGGTGGGEGESGRGGERMAFGRFALSPSLCLSVSLSVCLGEVGAPLNRG